MNPVIQYPLKALGEWGSEYLTCSHSTYKGMDRVLISEPSKMVLPRYYEYLPKKIHDTRNEVCAKYVADHIGDNPGLEAKYVTIKFILLRCNLAMDHRGDVEDHTYNTHGIDINEIDLESSIKVNEGEVLVLTASLNFKELSLEGRRSVYDSWFDASAANGTVTKVENRENAKIQKHKAGNLLKALKGAVGNDFFQKIYYQLSRQLKEGNDLYLGFQCRWSTFVTAVEDALGPMANVKRLKTYLKTKKHLSGGISLADTLYKCGNIVDETFGKVDITTEQEDKVERSNKPTNKPPSV